MDSIVEKKWFVYVGDRHEGPFSVEEIQEKVTLGGVTRDNFVWTEGMPDWKVMMEIADFGPPPSQVAKPIPTKKAAERVPELPPEETNSNTYQAMSQPRPELASIKARRAKDPILNKRKTQTEESQKQKNPKGSSSYKGWKILGILILCVAVLTVFHQNIFDFIQKTPELRAAYDAATELSRPHLLKMAEQYPSLSQWISPIPPLEDVSPDDLEELNLAAKEKVETGGSRFSIALSRANPAFPKFYVSSNLPDGAIFNLSIIGNPDTLLGQSSFVSQIEVTLQKKIGTSAIIQYPDGKPIPRGEYTIYLTPSETQPPLVKSILSTAQLLALQLPSELPKNSKILSYKTYFLGGDRDAPYLSRLKSYHDSLQAKATEEITNINQYAVTLENQFESTRTKFEALQQGKLTQKQRKEWETFHKEWSTLQSELHRNIQLWTPEAIKNEFFYGVLFQLTQQAEQAVEKMHEFQTAYFTKIADLSTLSIQLGESTSSARNSLTLLRSKIEQAEKIPPSPNGMPRRDGL